MHSDSAYSDPFIPPNALAELKLAAPEHDLLTLLPEAALHHDLLETLPHTVLFKSLDEHAYPLANNDLHPFESLGVVADFSESSLSDLGESPQYYHDCAWLSSASSQHPELQLRSWELFVGTKSCTLRGTFLSDKRADVFDSLIDLQWESSESLIPARSWVPCLTQLGLGRESLLFKLDVDGRSFTMVNNNDRLPGHSAETFKSFVSAMIKTGNLVREIRDLCRQNTRSATSMAILGEARNLLLAIEDHVLSANPAPQSLLQLQECFNLPRQLITGILEILKSIESLDSEVAMLSTITKQIKRAEGRNCPTQTLHFRMLEVASRPWLEKVSSWIGLFALPSSSCAPLPTFVSLPTSDASCSDLEFNTSDLPDFVDRYTGAILFETGLAFRLLRTYFPRNLDVGYENLDMNPWLIQGWDATWESLEQNYAAALEYEKKVSDEILKRDIHRCSDNLLIPSLNISVPPSGSGEVASAERDSPGLNIGNKMLHLLPIGIHSAHVELLDEQNENPPTGSSFKTPPMSIVPVLRLQPWVMAQSRVVNLECLRMLYNQFDLESHIQLLLRFQLLRDGPFTSRLSQALFDPDLQSSERRRGRLWTSTLGLQLGHRTTWPPSISELRLALMGILTDSYFSPVNAEQGSLFREELPGNLSFAIREMTDATLQQCVDQSSFFALDFLQIQYRASPPLDSIITSKALSRYDVLFRFLLRLQRMLFVVDRLSHASGSTKISRQSLNGHWLRFCHMSRHIVSVVTLCFSQSVAQFSEKITQRFRQVKRAIESDTGYAGETIAELRQWHEDTLNDALSALLLRKRQAPVMRLLEEIFSTILATARHFNTAFSTESTSELPDTNVRLAKKISVFVQACQDLTERIGNHSDNMALVNGPTAKPTEDPSYFSASHLLLNLGMNRYYAR